MPKSKKPRKSSVSFKPAAFPKGLRNLHKTETPTLMALSLLGTPHFKEEHLADLYVLPQMVAQLKGPACWLDVARTCEAIMVRAKRTGTYGCTGEEMTKLKTVVPELIKFISEQPNGDIARAAHAGLKEWSREIK